MDADYLRSRLDYRPDSGVFTWKPIPVKTWHDNSWNSRWSGVEAGSLDSHGHRQIRIDGVTYLAHRLAWFYVHGEWPVSDLDHRDRVKDNNAISNLRLANKSLNAMNILMRADNKSGSKGVCWDRRSNKWLVQLRVRGDRRYRGWFGEFEDAKAAYEAAASKHFGEFGARA